MNRLTFGDDATERVEGMDRALAEIINLMMHPRIVRSRYMGACVPSKLIQEGSFGSKLWE